MDEDVEERQFSPARGRFGYCTAYLATGIFRSVSAVARDYGQKWNYVEQNALRAGLIKEDEKWPYRGSIFDLMW
jgi:hypothetical protein